MPTGEFGRPQRQHSRRVRASLQAVEDAGLGVLVEIDQHVAAEDHVEGAEMEEVVQQIELPVLHHGRGSRR